VVTANLDGDTRGSLEIDDPVDVGPRFGQVAGEARGTAASRNPQAPEVS